MLIWPEEFSASPHQKGTVCDMIHLLYEAPFMDFPDLLPYLERLQSHLWIERDKKWWSLSSKGPFSVKSFYNFLIDWGLRCSMSRWFWHSQRPRKINLFNWLAWKNKILILENLEKRRYNRLPTATCVMCHSGIESSDHLFLHCSFAKIIWRYFINLFQLPESPLSLSHLGDLWRSLLSPMSKSLRIMIVKAIVWNIWLARNDDIFNANILPALSIVLKCNHMTLFWMIAADEGSSPRFKDAISTIR